MHHPSISVVIPVKNEASTIGPCLDAILNQTLEVKEIVVVDSGSTDGTREIIQEYQKVKFIRIDSKEFNHGMTRNLGVEHTHGEVVVLTVGDARPANDQWLENMVRHFSDPEVAGVCGHQVVPHEIDKNPHQWFRPQGPEGIRVVQFKNSDEFKNLIPQEKYNACKWDDVTAAYRRDWLNRIPFRRVSYGEDMIWALEALSHGLKLVYDKSALIYHYHHAHFDYQYKRTLTVLYHVYSYFDYLKSNPYEWDYPFRLIYRNIKYKVPVKWIWYNLESMAATHKAHRDISKWIKKGRPHLDEMHEKICKIAPQTIKKIVNE